MTEHECDKYKNVLSKAMTVPTWKEQTRKRRSSSDNECRLWNLQMIYDVVIRGAVALGYSTEYDLTTYTGEILKHIHKSEELPELYFRFVTNTADLSLAALRELLTKGVSYSAWTWLSTLYWWHFFWLLKLTTIFFLGDGLIPGVDTFFNIAQWLMTVKATWDSKPKGCKLLGLF